MQDLYHQQYYCDVDDDFDISIAVITHATSAAVPTMMQGDGDDDDDDDDYYYYYY